MSQGGPFAFEVALKWAKILVDELGPHVKRVKVAGSLRRRRPEVSDIELVAEPLLVAGPELDLFGQPEWLPDVARIRAAVEEWGSIVKGGDRYIQIEHGLGIGGLKVDLFIVHPPASWGTILAIRTGPALLGTAAVTRMRARGYRCEDGRVLVNETGEDYPTPEEADFFAAAGLPCLPPARRHEPPAFIGVDEPAWESTDPPPGELQRKFG